MIAVKSVLLAGPYSVAPWPKLVKILTLEKHNLNVLVPPAKPGTVQAWAEEAPEGHPVTSAAGAAAGRVITPPSGSVQIPILLSMLIRFPLASVMGVGVA